MAIVLVASLVLPGCGSSNTSANRPASEIATAEQAVKKAEQAPDTVPERNPVQTRNEWQFLGEEFAKALRPVCIVTAIFTFGISALASGGCP
ncbi:MAG: hypothetical protein AAB597_03400 [Patescibacteria group bacterium]